MTNKNESIYVKMSKNEKEEIQTKATIAGVSLSDYVRTVLTSVDPQDIEEFVINNHIDNN